MKYQIRKAEAITVYRASKVITLNDNDFRNLDENPYTGETEEDFMNYLADFDFQNPPDDLDFDTAQLLIDLVDASYEEYANSAEKGSDVYLQIGEANPEYWKTGGFKVNNETQTNY